MDRGRRAMAGDEMSSQDRSPRPSTILQGRSEHMAAPAQIVEYFNASTSKDFEKARSLLHDDLSFTGPIETLDNADALIESIERDDAAFRRPRSGDSLSGCSEWLTTGPVGPGCLEGEGLDSLPLRLRLTRGVRLRPVRAGCGAHAHAHTRTRTRGLLALPASVSNNSERVRAPALCRLASRREAVPRGGHRRHRVLPVPRRPRR